MMGIDNLIFHVCRAGEWATARAEGCYRGSSQDQADGFIHLSGFDHVRASVAKHRAGQDDLVILCVDPVRVPGATLKWELSRGGNLFPHIYGVIGIDAVVRTEPLKLGADGRHMFPADIGIEGGD